MQRIGDSYIAPGAVVTGDVVFAGGLRIDGHVRGNVKTATGEAATLVVSEQAVVDGEIDVSHVVVNGTVNGPVRVADNLELQAKARIAGDVSYRTVEMHVGAVVDGRLTHHEQGASSVVEFKRAAVDQA